MFPVTSKVPALAAVIVNKNEIATNI